MLIQSSLKSQDVVVSLKIALSLSDGFTYSLAAKDLGLSASRVHASVRMLVSARLAFGSSREGVSVNRTRLLELLVHGVPYFFPPVTGGPTRGIPTSSALQEIRQLLIARDEAAYVWPDAEGEGRGIALAPLHPCVVTAVRRDESLYRALMAVDALRVGDARERDIATNLLRKMLA